MDNFIRFVGPGRAVEVFNVRLVGLNAQTGMKIVFTLLFIFFLWALNWCLKKIATLALRGRFNRRAGFWTSQTIHLVLAALFLLALISIWFDNPSQLTTVFGLFSAGLAVALQKVITSLSGYFVILRGRTFNIGDRIVMGGVRGDVIGLGFIQTTIMEMGQPPAEQADEPAMWVRSRQYTGRLVTVTNDKIFEEPVFNYSHEFPYIWEEMMLPVGYTADRDRAEQILLDVAKKHTEKISDLGADAAKELRRRYPVDIDDWEPRVYWRLTDNWLELTVRFLTRTHDIRSLKDRMSREIIKSLDEAHIGIASSTYDVVGFPPLKIDLDAATIDRLRPSKADPQSNADQSVKEDQPSDGNSQPAKR
ncbi:MAG TPA: mechanosensitive ion channel domain-containing protein [Pirellulales bacterium]|nr:mechanosensitive ion channel domain-containing protein [Pirellulales bacterium]